LIGKFLLKPHSVAHGYMLMSPLWGA